jgi:hypothetical protein
MWNATLKVFPLVLALIIDIVIDSMNSIGHGPRLIISPFGLAPN